MIILRLLLFLTNLHLKLLSTQGTGADKLLSTQRVKQNNKNIIFTTIFATFYFEIVVKWSKSGIFEKFQLEHA